MATIKALFYDQSMSYAPCLGMQGQHNLFVSITGNDGFVTFSTEISACSSAERRLLIEAVPNSNCSRVLRLIKYF